MAGWLTDGFHLCGAVAGAGLAILMMMGLASPLLKMDVVTSSRRTRHFVLRVLYGLILLGFLGINHQGAIGNDSILEINEAASFARDFYLSLLWVQLTATALMTPALTAGLIATERERRTIEYLFASDLSNWEIVLGRLASRMLQLTVCLLVPLPIVSLASLFGGISGEDLAAAWIIAGSTLLGVGGVSLAASLWAKRGRDAVIASYLVLAALFLFPILVNVILDHIVSLFAASSMGWQIAMGMVEINSLFSEANPLSVAWNLSARGRRLDWTELLYLVEANAMIGCLSVLLAVFAVRRVHLRSVSSGEVAPKRRFWFRPALGSHAMLWKEVFAERWFTRLGWISYIATAIIFTAIFVPTSLQFYGEVRDYGLFSGGRWWGFSEFALMMSMVVSSGLLLLIGARAATCVTSERERDTWISLRSTMLSRAEILWAKLLGSLYAGRAVFLLLTMIWLMMFLIHPSVFFAMFFEIPTVIVLAVFCGLLGMRFSLSSRNSAWAMGKTVAFLIIIGGGYLFCCIPCVIASNSGPGDGVNLIFIPCIIFHLAMPIALTVGPSGSPDETIYVAYVLGMMGYFAGCFVLYFDCLNLLKREP